MKFVIDRLRNYQIPLIGRIIPKFSMVLSDKLLKR